ncbi:hypothetical protein A2930_04175 [Candidatus Giovannonibacteria bacterium RIFCSPLOWO2_01_FULL_45_34]|uniref:DUF5666 domain-containing protein n=1 Tax=Candidatus Giovannonibacteria bacterium RIFCSPLOWO2_01_FULL_45_34 TaxID=1798351 RepID=A0A1F5X198_9BACT|nr:MAG: hypothetical protein A3C73_04620 [Candidatus Giovannonibacteria bacterium RIFCSPHIGHO2_02_FULL_44_11]OGF81665.1 MAG: hypothetical protein A2930_04175 [Candidatus Giovannonibacteria bacterium RIFCSPLOWO2_01_FULL_45_34]
MNKSFKQISNIVIAILLSALVLSLIFIVFVLRTGFVQDWMEAQYFGRILEINSAGFSIVAGDEKKIEVLIKIDTDIREGRRLVAAKTLRVGDNVIAVGRMNAAGQVEASVLRIFPARNPR